MRRVCLLAALVLLCVVPVYAQAFVRGDANRDGRVDLSDPIKILLLLFRNAPPTGCADSADANDDGVVNVADAIAILGHLFANRGPLPSPFPRPGEDPSLDPLCCDGRCNPDLTGVWSGTFFDTIEGEYVVSFEVRDTEAGTMIVAGLESIANQIYGGEIFFWAGTGDRRLAFDYSTSFDIVQADFTLSADGTRMENGTFTTTSSTSGTFSMVRLAALASPPALREGAYKIVLLDDEETAAMGGRLTLGANGTVTGGGFAFDAIDPAGSGIGPSLDARDQAAGVFVGTLATTSAYAVSFVGMLGPDTGYLAGVFSDSRGMRGYFLMVPAP